MFAGGRRKSSLAATGALDETETGQQQQNKQETSKQEEESQLQQRRPLSSRAGSPPKRTSLSDDDSSGFKDFGLVTTSIKDEERQRFLDKTKAEANSINKKRKQSSIVAGAFKRESSGSGGAGGGKRTAKLAKQESIEADSGCGSMLLRLLKQKRAFIPLIVISCIAAIYCIPYVEIDPRVPKRLPPIPFNYRDGPLSPSSVSAFKVEHLFIDQIHGPESGATDSAGNMYLAIEGGFILYAHFKKQSPLKRAYYETGSSGSGAANFAPPFSQNDHPHLVKIAELNGIRQLPYDNRRREVRDGSAAAASASATNEGFSWRRECHLDEEVYGPILSSGGIPTPATIVSQQQQLLLQQQASSEINESNKFVSNVKLSRCSKPLGVRLSPDESYLYVVDTLSGLYRVNLKIPDRPHSTQRLVTRLIDFRANRHQLLPIVQLDSDGEQLSRVATIDGTPTVMHARSSYLNVSLMAIDDLVIDYGAGTRGGDIIYMTDASQKWIAVSFFYDMLEGKPSGLVLRYDTGSSQLNVMSPNRVAHVRTSQSLSSQPLSSRETIAATSGNDESGDSSSITAYSPLPNITGRSELYLGIGAPRLDENDVFDDRPLYFPNGLELTDDRQAILIADTTNKRIIKHYIRGARKGTSDLWAWTPNFPDNIRRGSVLGQETYWVVGCGQDTTSKIDLLDWLNNWPRVRKFMLKNVFLFGWLIENVGTHVFGSTSIRDYGYSFKTGSTICERVCPGMMVIQYNRYGDIIRSIYSDQFLSDLVYYSQVSEVIDSRNQEHILYLSSPSYNYLTKLTLPSDSFDLPSAAKAPTTQAINYEIG